MPLNSDFFAHYGVKGMKWGVRKDGSGTGRQRKAKTSLSKKAASLSDEELKTTNKRLQLEKRYVELKSEKNKRDRTTMEKGKAEVKKMLGKAAQNQLDNLTRNAMKGLVEAGQGQVTRKAKERAAKKAAVKTAEQIASYYNPNFRRRS